MTTAPPSNINLANITCTQTPKIGEASIITSTTEDDLCDTNMKLDMNMIRNYNLFGGVSESVSESVSEAEKLCSDQESPKRTLQYIRAKNINRIILGHLNINSIRNKIVALEDLVKNDIDILLISETKLDNSFPPAQFIMNSFSIPYRLDRNSHGGGLLFYIRNDITTKRLPLIEGGIECISLEINISKKKWLLMGIYNPHKSNISTFLSGLNKNLGHYMPYYDNVLLIGDFNSEMSDESMDEFCSLNNLYNLIKSPTCFKSTSNPSCIDLILTNRKHNFQNSTTIETGLSDFHHLTITIMKTTFRKKPPKEIKYRNYKNYNHENYKHDLNICLENTDLNDLPHNVFNNILIKTLDKHAPLKTKIVRGNDQPFMTKELRKEHMKRTRLLNQYRKNKSIESELSYKKQRNYCVKLLKMAKTTYYGNLNPSSICDNKKFWNTVKPLLSDKCVTSENIILHENRKIISDNKQIADIFNNYFSNAVKGLNLDYFEHFSWDCICSENEDPILKSIEKYSNHPSVLKIKGHYPQTERFSFKPTNLEVVLKEVEHLNESKSAPIDSVPAKVLKDVQDIVCPKIVIDFNSAISTGIFPTILKLADVIPLFKNENRLYKGNYRPVSLLAAISKVFERIMHHQMSAYMKNKLSIFLCGFQKYMSGQNCLTFMVEMWKKALDKSQKCGIILTDLSKAFDCLLHDLLIAKLEAYGFDYLSLKLIYSYLTYRKQRVRVGSEYSEWKEIEYGVPQGSIIGPELYNYNSNDLFLFMSLAIINYADDNTPFSSAPSIPSVIDNLEEDSKILLNWIKYNGLKANPDKFHLLLSEPDNSLSMKIDGFEISNSLSEKLLGVKFDSKMKFKEHVTGLCTIASQKLHALSRIGIYMTLKQRKTIMKSFILSQFGYCPLVWMFHCRKLNNRINNIHEKALRIVYQDSHSSFDSLLKKENSFTIHKRNIQTLAIELYKVAYGISPKIMRLVFPTKENVHYPWENIFKTSNVKTVHWGTETLSHIGPKIWMIIPQATKKLPFKEFKMAIRLWNPEGCPCRMCRYYLHGVGFINVI